MPEIQGARLIADLRRLAEFGKYKTGVHRPTYTSDDMAARHWLAGRTGHVCWAAACSKLPRKPVLLLQTSDVGAEQCQLFTQIEARSQLSRSRLPGANLLGTVAVEHIVAPPGPRAATEATQRLFATFWLLPRPHAPRCGC